MASHFHLRTPLDTHAPRGPNRWAVHGVHESRENIPEVGCIFSAYGCPRCRIQGGCRPWTADQISHPACALITERPHLRTEVVVSRTSRRTGPKSMFVRRDIPKSLQSPIRGIPSELNEPIMLQRSSTPEEAKHGTMLCLATPACCAETPEVARNFDSRTQAG